MLQNSIQVLYFIFVILVINGLIIATWRDVRNRRSFFDEYAKEKGFDSKIPEHWYKQSIEYISSLPVCLQCFFLFCVIIDTNYGVGRNKCSGIS